MVRIAPPGARMVLPKVHHRVDFAGNRFTECFYTSDRKPAYARLHGHLRADQARDRIEANRIQAAQNRRM